MKPSQGQTSHLWPGHGQGSPIRPGLTASTDRWLFIVRLDLNLALCQLSHFRFLHRISWWITFTWLSPGGGGRRDFLWVDSGLNPHTQRETPHIPGSYIPKPEVYKGVQSFYDTGIILITLMLVTWLIRSLCLGIAPSLNLMLCLCKHTWLDSSNKERKACIWLTTKSAHHG